MEQEEIRVQERKFSKVVWHNIYDCSLGAKKYDEENLLRLREKITRTGVKTINIVR